MQMSDLMEEEGKYGGLSAGSGPPELLKEGPQRLYPFVSPAIWRFPWNPQMQAPEPPWEVTLSL